MNRGYLSLNERSLVKTFVLNAVLVLCRILYSAPSSGDWGEHELDYILLHRGDVQTIPNPEEVKICQVNKKKIRSILAHCFRIFYFF